MVLALLDTIVNTMVIGHWLAHSPVSRSLAHPVDYYSPLRYRGLKTRQSISEHLAREMNTMGKFEPTINHPMMLNVQQ